MHLYPSLTNCSLLYITHKADYKLERDRVSQTDIKPRFIFQTHCIHNQRMLLKPWIMTVYPTCLNGQMLNIAEYLKDYAGNMT